VLAQHFLRRFADQFGKQTVRFSSLALGALEEHDWPGNVRQLENVVQRAVVLAEGPTVEIWHLPAALGSPLVPAQKDFVVPYRIQTVLGFGGPLPSGDIFAMILFTKVVLSHDTAELFKPLSLSLKLAVLEHAQQVFA
jgi:DNA-binding NtrC family response regulator